MPATWTSNDDLGTEKSRSRVKKRARRSTTDPMEIESSRRKFATESPESLKQILNVKTTKLRTMDEKWPSFLQNITKQEACIEEIESKLRKFSGTAKAKEKLEKDLIQKKKDWKEADKRWERAIEEKKSLRAEIEDLKRQIEARERGKSKRVQSLANKRISKTKKAASSRSRG